MMTRRNYLKLCVAVGAGSTLAPGLLWASQTGALITRPIPSSGQRLPVVGLGSSATFSSAAGGEDVQALTQVFRAFVEQGGSVFDTAPSYGASEAVSGKIVNELGIKDKIFWATKLNVAGFGGGKADVGHARAQIEASFKAIDNPVIDLIQVHNLGDLGTQLPVLKALREEQRIRYMGVTTTFPRQYEQLEKVMREEPLDFIGVDYAIDNRVMEERILPLAADRGIGVLVYAPFGRTRLWSLVKGHDVPAWATELGIRSWAQFFLKFVISHPAVTCATPATSRPRNVIDNMGAAFGDLPDAATRERMAAYIQAL
ncbi:aldo/keto reductase [Allopusillimonas ginsengisoli]|uniref:aldo/keto reductase n=1 Tax=Allopusillimonas ginsengisoli TaxID=453575 RepID=UPI00101EF2DC|nr:aldo/keto reductase [Allopusillimonas ginsengisoli]TEA77725.1 aldo/keto reductase [Allopusillimonas ginsengisoli]